MKYGKDIGYQMSQKMFNNILSMRSEEEKKMNPYAFVASYVNQQFNLRGIVKRVTIFNG